MQWDLATAPSNINTHKLLAFAENTLVCLMCSWNSRLISGGENVGNLSAAGLYFRVALIYSGFCKRVFQATGWTLRDVGGLNWSTPILEINDTHEKTIWTGVFIPSSRNFEKGKTYMKQFRRTPVTLLAKKRSNHTYDTLSIQLYHKPSGSAGQRILITIPKEDVEQYKLKMGMKVNVVVEIRLDGKPHPTPYARFPAIGPFPDWPNLNTLAIILEWKDENDKDKAWKSLPIQTSFLFNKPKKNEVGYGKPEAPFLAGPYKKVSALVSGLMNYQWTGTPAYWSYPSSFMRVQDCYADHYTQTLEITTAKPWKMAPLRLLSRAEMERQLDTKYRISNPDGSITRLAMG